MTRYAVRTLGKPNPPIPQVSGSNVYILPSYIPPNTTYGARAGHSVDGVTLELSSGKAQIKDGGVSVAKCGAGIVTASSLVFPIWAYDSVTGTFAWAAIASAYGGFQFQSSSAAQNDQIVFKADIPAGTYKAILWHTTSSDCAIATIKIGATSIGTIDMYSADQTFNVTAETAGAAVATSGIQDVTILFATKNGAASAYGCRLYQMALVRTA